MAEAPLSIAVVDDDPAVLKALSRLLRSRGFRVQTYGSGQEFLASLAAGRPECLIVDLRMPDMNGKALQQHLADSRMKIPTILLTADGDYHGDLIGSLRKPVLEKALFTAIDRAIVGQGGALLRSMNDPINLSRVSDAADQSAHLLDPVAVTQPSRRERSWCASDPRVVRGRPSP